MHIVTLVKKSLLDESTFKIIKRLFADNIHDQDFLILETLCSALGSINAFNIVHVVKFIQLKQDNLIKFSLKRWFISKVVHLINLILKFTRLYLQYKVSVFHGRYKVDTA